MSEIQRGVTLIEMLMVLACLGILAAVALPTWIQRGWPAYRLKNAAHQVIADVRYARTRAVATNQRCRLHFSPDCDTYVLEEENSAGGSPPWIEAGSVRYFGQGGGMSFKGIRIGGEEDYSIVFYPTGGVTGATVTLQNSLDHTMKVICSMAGRIRIARE